MRMRNSHELAKVEFVARKDCRAKAPMAWGLRVKGRSCFSFCFSLGGWPFLSARGPSLKAPTRRRALPSAKSLPSKEGPLREGPGKTQCLHPEAIVTIEV